MTHTYSTKDVCTKCGCSKAAVDLMGWTCKPSGASGTQMQYAEPDKAVEPASPLEEAIDAVTAEAMESLRLIADATEKSPDDFNNAARRLNPGAIARRALRVADDLERQIFADIDEIMSPEDELQDWRTTALPHFQAGWLRRELEDDIRELERSMRDLREASLAYGRFWASNAGFGGFVKRAVGGYLNPLDGWLAWVGKSSVNTEQDRLVADFADSLSNVSNDCESLTEEIITRSQIKFSEIRSAKANQSP